MKNSRFSLTKSSIKDFSLKVGMVFSLNLSEKIEPAQGYPFDLAIHQSRD
jgi:hypothetical protein